MKLKAMSVLENADEYWTPLSHDQLENQITLYLQHVSFSILLINAEI